MNTLIANPDEGRIVAAVLLSLVIHAAALVVFPNLRPLRQPEPEVLQVDLVPLPAPPKPVEPVAPAPPEPEIKPIEPEPVVKPKSKPEPQPKPKAKAVKKKEPAEAPPPKPVVPEESAPEPASPPVIAAPPQPRVTESPVFKVPAPPAEPPKVIEPPPAEVIDGYGETLSRLIARYQRYPRIAQMRGWEGSVQVAIDIGAQGRIAGMKVRQSSGFEVLDKQALEMVKQAIPFPPAPQSLRGKEFVVNVPIIFRLKN
ncbi:MAG TPA: TonB family protein [Burkholderiales bacterium]|nr:TonB family protein [Burkholderiales bacterium]